MSRFFWGSKGLSSLGSLGAQGLNFVALLLPIFFGRLDQVAILVVTSAIAGISAFTFTFAFSSIYPGITDSESRKQSFGAAVIGVMTSSILLVLIGAAIALFAAPWGIVVFWSGVVTLCQGLYLVATTVLVQQLRHGRFAATRIAYATVNVLLTLLFSVVLLNPYGLVMAAAVCFAIGAAVASWGKITALRDHLAADRLNLRDAASYVRANWAATLSNLFAGLAFQSSALATGFLGSFAGSWAGIIRVAGGFAGISQQVVSPPYDMRLSSAIRIGSALQIRRTILTTIIFGLAMAISAYVAVWGIFFFSIFVSSRTLEVGSALPVLLTGGIYTFGVLIPSVCSKFLVMLGHQKPYFAWVLSKLGFTAVALTLLRGLDLLLALACLELLSATAFVLLLVFYRNRPHKLPQRIDVPVA